MVEGFKNAKIPESFGGLDSEVSSIRQAIRDYNDTITEMNNVGLAISYLIEVDPTLICEESADSLGLKYISKIKEAKKAMLDELMKEDLNDCI